MVLHVSSHSIIVAVLLSVQGLHECNFLGLFKLRESSVVVFNKIECFGTIIWGNVLGLAVLATEFSLDVCS